MNQLSFSIEAEIRTSVKSASGAGSGSLLHLDGTIHASLSKADMETKQPPVPLGYLLLGVIGAVLAVGAICIFLWRCGFFARQRLAPKKVTQQGEGAVGPADEDGAVAQKATSTTEHE